LTTPLALALTCCVLIEVAVGLAIWLALGRDSGEPVSAPSQPSAIIGSRPVPTIVPVARPTLDFHSAYPTLAPRPTAAALAEAAPTQAPPLATQVPDADQVWLSVLPAVDAAWGRDTPNAIRVLEDFLSRFPAYGPATDKLYAALLAYSVDLQDAGDPDAAAEMMLKAQALMPDRGEASAALLALQAPDPEPPVTSDALAQVAAVAEQPRPTPAPPATVSAVRAAPTPVGRTSVAAPAARAAPAAQVAPAAPAPTPTKAPFVPPGRAAPPP
jgi:hypothetical protein